MSTILKISLSASPLFPVFYNTPERRHKVKGRNSFAFSDLRHIVAKVALSKDFGGVAISMRNSRENLLWPHRCAWSPEKPMGNYGESSAISIGYIEKMAKIGLFTRASTPNSAKFVLSSSSHPHIGVLNAKIDFP